MARRKRKKPKTWTATVARDVEAVKALSPVRAYWERVLEEPRPQSPQAPYEGPVPPEWMRAPEMAIGPGGQPSHWIDTDLVNDWEHRMGEALYELDKEDVRDRLRAAGEAREDPAWDGAPSYDPRLRDLRSVNHPANLLTVQQRQERGLTRSWGRKAPPPREEELPEAEMCWAPWWLE
ncbi:hypothetical protein [Streptomyces amritsarensis]|uniref:hypothetical protein n=1 Tax=Streptomyces amritsarensis TaxID=681158 RepID=UPI0036A48C6A